MRGGKRVSTCAYCGGSNDGKSDICTRPACLARYWRKMAERAQASAREYLKRAESLEAEAKAELDRAAASLLEASAFQETQDAMVASIRQQIENGVEPRGTANQ